MRFCAPSNGVLKVYLSVVCIVLALGGHLAEAKKPDAELEEIELEPIQLSSVKLSSTGTTKRTEESSSELLVDRDDAVVVDPEIEAAEIDQETTDKPHDEATPAEWSEKNRSIFGIYEKAYAGAYDTINKELVKNVATDNAAENIEYAKTWLNLLKSKTTFLKEDLKAALEQFIELGSIIDDHIKCNRVTYAILRKNMRGVRGKALKYDTPHGPIRRVDKIVFKYAMEHAIKCLPKYPGFMNELVNREDLKPVERVINVFQGLYSSFTIMSLLYSDDGICTKPRNFNPSSKKEGQIAMKGLFKLAHDNPTDLEFLYQPEHQNEEKGEMEVDRSKVEAIVDKYITEPCRHFVREVSLNVVKPAKLDFSVLDKQDAENIKTQLNNSEFCVGRQRYGFCKIIIKRRNIIINNLISEMRKNSNQDIIMNLLPRRK